MFDTGWTCPLSLRLECNLSALDQAADNETKQKAQGTQVFFSAKLQ